jgi:hypothetical protein
MTTEKQIAANRENAKKSTGPKTVEGKRKARRNAFRHGLAAETLIEPIEDLAAYGAVARKINEDYRPATNLERQLVGRLVSLLWRLRRATAIEAGLLALQTDSSGNHGRGTNLDVFYRLLGSDKEQCEFEFHWPEKSEHPPRRQASLSSDANTTKLQIARSFLRVAVVDGVVFERFSRYEASLWRQTVEVILLLNSISMSERTPHGRLSEKHLRLRRSRMFQRVSWPPFASP